ncbi:MAG: AAA family ATPase, partial [Leptolyngbyaceae bacterium]|nr:AAA family ATPase [Leptolyngbyaceae bacterium]
MIPVQLRLKNFLSYRDATLDFGGLHVACVCGANGAGKSSLLEAIAWVVWGQSRATTDDDVIHMGELEAHVDFTFRCHQQLYRIIRTRCRKRGATLEFQVKAGEGFRTLTGRGMRATQALIQHHIRLDYDTFINSAYLRQGRADEFMLKRPSERKQILSDLLKLDQYDELAERARERSRYIKAELDTLTKSLHTVQHQLEDEPLVHAHVTQLEDELTHLRHQQSSDQEQLKTLREKQQQRQAWIQEQSLKQQRYQHGR